MRDSAAEGRTQHTRGAGRGRTRAAASFLAGLLLGALAAAPAPASDIRVEFDDDAAELITTAFRRDAVNPELIEDIVRTTGYRLLFRHEAIRSGRDPEQVEREFRAALGAALDGAPDPGYGLQFVRARPDAYRRTLREIRSVGGNVAWRVVQRVNGFLPPASGFTTTAHLVVGGKEAGRAFGDLDDVTLRVDDFVPPGETVPLDTDRFASVLAHELFHVGFRAAGGPPPRPAEPTVVYENLVEEYGAEVVGEVWRASGNNVWDDREMQAKFDAWVPPPNWDLLAFNELIAMMSLVQNEGCAVYVDAPLRDPGSTRLHAGEMEGWLRDVDGDFGRLGAVTELFARGADPDKVARVATDLLADDGPLYRVGYRMAERIDTLAGRRPLLSSMRGGPLEFFETYLETHPYGPGTIDSRTESVIEAVIREIRGMGDFDPDED